MIKSTDNYCVTGTPHRWPALFMALAATALTSGCAFRPQTTRMAIDHNDFVAETTNGQTVLNILRAREREPMHFTSFSKVTGNVSATGTINTNLAINGDGGSRQRTDTTAERAGTGGTLIDQTVTGQDLATASQGATNVTPQVSLQIATGTLFDVAVNANDEFYKGILGTLPNSLIVHYLRQGFPADLISHLVIGRLDFYAEVTGPGNATTRYLVSGVRNSPDEAEEIKSFANAMKCRHLSYVPDPQAAKSLPLDSPATLSGLAPELASRLKGVNASATYSLETPARSDFKIALSEPSDECVAIRDSLGELFKKYAKRMEIYDPKGISRTGGPAAEKLITTTAENAASVNAAKGPDELRGQGGASFASKGFFNKFLKDEYNGDLVIEMSFRSIEGVLYYLGEYARNENPTPKLTGSSCANKSYCLPVIRVRPTAEIAANRRWVTVRYRGERYSVPISGAKLDETGGRSSQTISLVQQLLNLTKTAKELPNTPTVRIVN